MIQQNSRWWNRRIKKNFRIKTLEPESFNYDRLNSRNIKQYKKDSHILDKRIFNMKIRFDKDF